MNNLLNHCLLLFIPLIVANSVHMLIVKLNIFSNLVIPVAQGMFGENKTLRGFVVVPLMAALTMLFVGLIVEESMIYSIVLGFILGVVYLLAELPNSWLKRRLNVPSGGTHPKYKYLFLILDKSDSAFGVTFFYFMICSIRFSEAILIFIIGVILHSLFSLLLYFSKIKKAF